MPRKELHRSLEQLRRELNKLQGTENDFIKKRMNSLLGDVEHQLENPEDSLHKTTLLEGLKAEIEQFETEHPQLTGILNHIMVTFSNLGI